MGNGSYGTKIWPVFVLPDGSIWVSDRGFGLILELFFIEISSADW
jgi:hypothetical protein